MQQAAAGWGRLSSQLYQSHWEPQEHSGWSDDDEHDPDMLQPHTGAHLIRDTFLTVCVVDTHGRLLCS